MTIRKIERYRGGSASEITRFAALGKAKNLALGAISYSVARIHTGEHAGTWLAEIAYRDWAAYGRITEALAADAQWQKDMAGLATLSTLEFRMLVVELDL